MLRLTDLRVNDVRNPLGMDDVRPRLSWAPLSGGAIGRAEARVVAASSPALLSQPDVWDSGWREADAPALRYGGPAPNSGQRIWWRAMMRAEGQATASDPAWFEMGLLDASDWRARWIAADPDQDAPVLMRAFHLDCAPLRARAYVSGLGFFELTVNGARVGDELLQPVWTAYGPQRLTNMLYPHDARGAHRVPYRTFDIGGLLRAGENLVEVLIGNGWFHQNVRNVEGDLWYGECPQLLASLHMDGAVLGTDADWRWQKSATLQSNLFEGEVQDARSVDGAPRPVRVVDAPAGMLRAQTCPSDAVIARYRPAEARPDAEDPARLIVDFAQNLSGWVALEGVGLPGDALEVRFAEEVGIEGCKWRLDCASAGGDGQIQRDAFILSGGHDALRPKFTWHGFRYASFLLTRGCEPVPLRLAEGRIEADRCSLEVRAEFVSSNHALTGELSLDSEQLNWFHGAFIASMRANQHCGVPMDCPHRERLGYTGDGQLSAPAVLLNADAMPFFRKWLDDILDAQNRETGHVPHTAPFYGGGGGPGGWGGAVALLPWTLYRHSGDIALLERAYPAMTRYLGYLWSHGDNGIVTREEPGGWCLGEWCTPGEVTVPPELVNTYFHILVCDRAAWAAATLGHGRDARAWTARADGVRTAFHGAFFDAERCRYGPGAQGADAFALHAGAVPEPLRARVFEGMAARLAARGWRFDTGMFGTPVLLSVLARHGRAEDGFRLMTAPEPPGFVGSMRAHGATTLYESWDGGSHNHAMFGAADAWLYAYAGGLAQADDSVGWAKVCVRPGWINALSRGSARVRTPRGPAHVQWSRIGGALRVRVDLPCTVTGVLLPPPYLATPAIQLSPGRSEFVLAVPPERNPPIRTPS